jgi:hypothetical protein
MAPMQCEFGDLAMSLVGLTKLEAALQGTTPNSGVQRAVTVAPPLRYLPIKSTRRKLCSHIFAYPCAVTVVRSLYEPSSRVRPNARTFTILMAGVTRANMGSQGKGLCLALYQEAISQVRLPPNPYDQIPLNFMMSRLDIPPSSHALVHTPLSLTLPPSLTCCRA